MGRRRAKGTGAPPGGQPTQAVIATVAALAAMLEGGLPAFTLGARTRMTPTDGLNDFIEIEDEQGNLYICIPVYWEEGQVWLADAADNDLTPHEVFSGANKQELREFIAFCRQGGFEGVV
jgi:hypothetical protein